MLSPLELDKLLKEIANPASWHWKMEKGWFSKKTECVEEKHVHDLLTELEHSNDSFSLQQVEVIRARLKDIQDVFKKQGLTEQVDAIALLVGTEAVGSGKVWSTPDVPVEFYSEVSDENLQLPKAVSFALSQGSVLQSAREAVIYRMHAGKDDKYYYSTRTSAIYFGSSDGLFVAFDDDAFENILLSPFRAEEGRQAGDSWLVDMNDPLISRAISRARNSNRVIQVTNKSERSDSINVSECIIGDKTNEYADFVKRHLNTKLKFYLLDDSINLLGVTSSKALIRLVGLGYDIIILNALDQCYYFRRSRGVQKISSGNQGWLLYVGLMIFKKLGLNEAGVSSYFNAAEAQLKDKKAINLFYAGLGVCINLINSKQELDNSVKIFLEIIKECPHNFLAFFFRKIGAREINSFDELEKMLSLAQAYWDLLGESEYTIKLIFENLDKLRPLDANMNRLSFRKTGSELIPLGGKLAGFLFRIVTKEAFDAWSAAEKVLQEKKDGKIIGHCEPIVRAYNRKNDFVSVVTKYAGQAVRSYKSESESERMEIERQMNWIKDQLSKSDIQHGHAHKGNFVVRKENDEIIVTMIDFDMAVSPPKSE